MYESGKCANVVKEMKNYQLEILVYLGPDGLKQDKQILPRMKPSYILREQRPKFRSY